MSEPGPDSIPTSSSRISHRPTKKRALSPTSQHTQQLEALFAHPDREIALPNANKSLSKTSNAPPEIVANVQGSSAGAGSGEFHVYKASRRREYERLRVMDEEVERERADREFVERQEEVRRRDEERLERNRAKREKSKLRAMKGKGKGAGGGGEGGVEGDGEGKGSGGVVKKKLGAAKILPRGGEEVEGTNGEVGGDGDGQAVEEEVGIMIHDDD